MPSQPGCQGAPYVQAEVPRRLAEALEHLSGAGVALDRQLGLSQALCAMI